MATLQCYEQCPATPEPQTIALMPCYYCAPPAEPEPAPEPEPEP
jgi:hypothetical protein